MRLDAVVTGPSGDYLAVEVKSLARKVTTTEVTQAVQHAVSLARESQTPERDENSQVVRLLLISNQELHGPWIAGSLDRFFGSVKIYLQHVRVMSKADLLEVTAAIRAAFGISAEGPREREVI